MKNKGVFRLRGGKNKSEKKENSTVHGDVDMIDAIADTETESVRSGESKPAPAPAKLRCAEGAACGLHCVPLLDGFHHSLR